MGRRAFKIEAVTRFQLVFLAVNRDFKVSSQDVDKLLALVSIRISASRLRSDSKQMGLHHRVAPCQQFHSYTRARLENLPLRRTYAPSAGLTGIKKIQNVGFVEARQFTQRSHRPAHLR